MDYFKTDMMDKLARTRAVLDARQRLGAQPSDGTMPGLWNVPGYPELTTNQLLNLARARHPSG